MKGALETMVGVLMLTLMAVLGTSYLTAALNIQNAQNYHAAVITEIEESDYSDSVIAACQNKAVENGYKTLTVTPVVNTEGNKFAKVVLEYDYTIPYLNLLLEHEIVGYAR